jgi:branched-chain amino acid transport system permease protein
MRRLRGLAVLAAIVALLPLVLPNRFYYDVALHIGLNGIVAVGLNLLIGYAGQISLGHAAFVGLGAYGAALLTKGGVPAPLSILAAMALAGVVALVIGRPILRLRGHYLAMATLGFGVILAIVLNNESWLTGGPDGMNVPSFRLGDWRVRGAEAWYWVTGVALVGAVWLALNLVESPTGRALRALHGSEPAAQSLGIDVARYKVLAFVVSAVFAALAGGLGAFSAGFITPDRAGFLRSIELVSMVVLGGMASTWGALVGAAILTTLPQLLTLFKDYELVLLGAILMGCMIFLPQGLVPSLARLARRTA